MFTYCFNNKFIFISLLCILYFYDDKRCKMNFPVWDNKVLLYCIVKRLDVTTCILTHSTQTNTHTGSVNTFSANILLDDDFTAKLADCALARPGPTNRNHSVTYTDNIIGTTVYMPLEYKQYSVISTKIDSYSYGVVGSVRNLIVR